MDLLVFRVDWPWVLAKKAAGDFEDAFHAEWEKRKSKKAIGLEALGCMDIYFFTVARAYAQMAPKLAPETRKAADAFFLPLIVENRMCQDLGDEVLFRGDLEPGGIFQHSLSPESVARVLKAGEALDFAALEKAYASGVDQRAKSELEEFFEVEPKAGFQQAFIPFVQSWIDGLREAAQHGMGMLSRFD